jgi:hypothetical protein
MSEPRRLLLDGGASERERDILRAWEGVGPSPGARARTLASLGLAGGVGAAVTSTLGAKAAVGTGVTGSIAPKAAGIGAASALKWLAIGAATLAVGAGTVGYVARTGDVRRPVIVSAPAATQSPVAAPASTLSAPAPSDPIPVDALPRATPPAPSAQSPASPGGASLAEQIAAIDAARTALAAGDPSGAVRLASQYEARFPRGSFWQEAEVIRIDAMLRSGDRASAEAAARRFVAAHPTSPHAARLRALLERSTP